MYKCKWCGEENEPGLEYCLNCGQPIVLTKPCARCGAEIPINVRLCTNCGAFMDPAPTGMTAAGNIVAPAGAAAAAAPVGMPGMQVGVPGAQMGVPGAQMGMPGAPGMVAPGQQVYQSKPAAARRPREMWERGPTVDWICWLALGMSIVTGILYWVPRMGIIFSVLSLLVIGFGAFRYYTLRDEHVHYWILIVAAVIAVLALIFSIIFTKKAENVGIPGTMLLRFLFRC